MRQVFRLPSYRCKLDLITFSSIIRSVWKKPWYLLRNSGFSHLQAHYSIDRLKPCLPGKTESVGESLASEKEGSCLVEPEKIYLVQNMSLFPSDTTWPFSLSFILALLWCPQAMLLLFQSLCHVWLCDPMDWNMSVSSVLQIFPEFAQIHGHWFGDAT